MMLGTILLAVVLIADIACTLIWVRLYQKVRKETNDLIAQRNIAVANFLSSMKKDCIASENYEAAKIIQDHIDRIPNVPDCISISITK